MTPCNESRYPITMRPPERTFHMRPLPFEQTALDSEVGRRFFAEALLDGSMSGYFRLAQQFHTQSDPAYCGLGALVCGLNALGIDPGRQWKGPWRWFAEELLDCCKSLDEIRRFGLTLDEVECLARCNGADVAVRRPGLEHGVERFREQLIEVAARDVSTVLIVNYSRRALGQTGDGHFSPVGGYHARSDSALVLDTARFKYPPHWVPIDQLYAAMQTPDNATGLSRGWMALKARSLPH